MPAKMLPVLEIDVFQIPGGRRTQRIDGSIAIVGRSAKCHVVVRDPDVSRRHLKIELVDGQLWAEDMGSSNGSTLDGEPLAQRSPVAEGQVLRVCDHEFRVRIIPAEADISATPSSGQHAHHSAHPSSEQPYRDSSYGDHGYAEQQPYAEQPPPHSAHPYSAPTGQSPAAVDPSGYPTQLPANQPEPQHAAHHHPHQPAAHPHQTGAHHAPLMAPAPGRVMVPEDAPLSPRTFECIESIWQSYEQMAQEAGVPVDDLVNHALHFYGRRRVYANAGSTAQPRTSLHFAPSARNMLELMPPLKT